MAESTSRNAFGQSCYRLIVAVFALLILVKWISIGSGPSAHEAITAIRVAEWQVFQAESAMATARGSGAESEERIGPRPSLDRAWWHLELKQYREALAHAQYASEKASRS